MEKQYVYIAQIWCELIKVKVVLHTCVHVASGGTNLNKVSLTHQMQIFA